MPGGMVMISRSAGRGAGKRQAVAEAESAVPEAAAAAERYSTLGPRPTDDDLVSRLADLGRLRESGALSAAEFVVRVSSPQWPSEQPTLAPKSELHRHGPDPRARSFSRPVGP